MKNKKILIALACVIFLGVAAVFMFGGNNPPAAEPNEVVENSAPPDANVGGIDGKTAPNPITTPSTTPAADPDPIIDPDSGDNDVNVSLTEPTSRPPEADVDPNPDTHERGEEDKPAEPTAPPAHTPPTPAPTQPAEPQGGDTNGQGQVWVPGFGWVTNGGDNQGEIVDSDGDINKQVGDM